MTRETIKIDGLKSVEEALKTLPASTGKSVLRRVLKKRAQPIADDYASKVRVDEGALRDSIGVSSRLTKRQGSLHRKMFKDDRASVELFLGAGGLTQAITEEFGTVDQPAHPGLRPAWDAGRKAILEGIKDDLWAEVQKSAARRAKKLAKGGR